jgi:cytochrome c
VVVLALALTGCTFLPWVDRAPGPSASPESSEAVVTQVARGNELYINNCSRCHGDQGQGDIGPPIIGPRQGLRGYGTAQGLYDYVSRVMPFDAAGSLPAQTYWDILAFVISKNGYVLPEGAELGPENASSVDISN